MRSGTRTCQLFFAYSDQPHLGEQPWEVPFGRLRDEASLEVLGSFYQGYGDMAPWGEGPDQEELTKHGNGYIRGAFAKVDFPESDTVANNTFSSSTVSAGTSMFRTGSYIEDSYTGTGVTEVTGLSYAFIIDDGTTTVCSVGTLTFDVKINGTKVGSASFVGGNSGKNLTITGTHSFSAVAGTGTNNDEYTLRVEATNSVCGGAATYQFRPGGQFFLRP